MDTAVAGAAADPIPVPQDRVDLGLEGMTCAACAARIEKVLNRVPGVAATVNYASETAAVRFDGQVSVFDLRDDLSPCYHCLFPENAELEETRCAVMGVFAPITGIIGTVQSAEALKLLAGAGETLKGRLLILDALAMQWRTVKLAKDAACAVCARVTA